MAAGKQFFVHERRGVVRVKQGFCWPAFFFGALWAAAKGLWFPTFLGLMVLDGGLWFATGYAEASGLTALALLCLAATVAYAVMRGRYGNEWLRAGLLRKGYRPGAQG